MGKQVKELGGNLSALQAGSIFTYGGQKWILLENNDGAALCLALDVLGETRAFDENDRNDWTISTLRDWLNEEYIKELIGAGADPDAFLSMTVDLTSDDGLTEYGRDDCKIALISCEQYRRYRKLIRVASNWWWTLTPWSTANNGYSRIVRRVDTVGALSNGYACYGDYGVRPLCSLKSSILVSFNHDEATGAELKCADCGAELTFEEAYYYETRCEACEKAAMNESDEGEETKKEPKPEGRAAALDVIRHIAAARGLTVEEITEAVKEPPNVGGAGGE